MSADTFVHAIPGIIFTPLPLFFLLQLITSPSPQRNQAANPLTPTTKQTPKSNAKSLANVTKVNPEEGENITDADRRAFIRLIGSAGAAIFMMALFTKRAEAAFFGSVPGPGTLALKDSAGNKIDPAEKHPTDGYKITQLDDTSSATYAYYGFINKSGAWYIQRETLSGGSAGQYLYSKGASSFSTNWTNRASLTYDYFDVIF